MRSKCSIRFPTMTSGYAFFVAVFTLLSFACLAQGDSVRQEEIAVLARPWSDSIALRWAPRSFKIWADALKAGYRIERFVIARDGEVLAVPERRILHSAVLPLEEYRWENLVRRNPYAAIAAQAIFGDRFELDLRESNVFTIVNKVRENEQRHSFALFCADMSPEVARAAGLWFTDKEVQRGERYLYRIVLNKRDSARGSTFSYVESPYLLVPPQGLTATFQEGVISLKWERDASGMYTAYTIERSSDGVHFSSISETPQVNASATAFEDSRFVYAVDSVPSLYQRYHYRVRGLSPFGESSAPSNVVQGVPTRSVSRNPQITGAENVDNHTIHVAWDFPAEDNALISGFVIERAENPTSTFVVLNTQALPSSARNYIDLRPKSVNYYRVVAKGFNGESFRSHTYFTQLVDSIPPATPTGLQATIDADGHLLLAWEPNSDPDLYGYRVYRSYYASEEAAQMTAAPIPTEQFRDTLNLATLNDQVYYSVMAVDQNQNHSALSTPLRVALPDRVAPQPPILLPCSTHQDTITLRWIPSPSPDVATYKLYRRSGQQEGWEAFAIVHANPDSVLQHIDIRHENTYYTILAVDDAGLESEPAHPVLAVSRQKQYAAVRWEKFRLDRSEGKVLLAWRYLAPDVVGYRLYKSINDAPITLYQSLASERTEFTDILIPGTTYVYRIIALHRDGSFSKMSDSLILTY